MEQGRVWVSGWLPGYRAGRGFACVEGIPGRSVENNGKALVRYLTASSREKWARPGPLSIRKSFSVRQFE